MATMSSRAMFVVVLSLALCSQSANAATRDEILVAQFRWVSILSLDLNGTVFQLTRMNALTEGGKVAPGLQNIEVDVANATSMLQNDPSRTQLTVADAKLVVDPLTTLLATVISMHGLVTMIPYRESIRQALVSLEKTVDSFALALIAFIPTSVQSDYTAQFDDLKVQVLKTITAYS